MTFYSFIIIPSFCLLTILVYLIFKFLANNPSRKKAVNLNNYLKNTISTLKTERKDSLVNSKESFNFEEYLKKVNELIDASDLFQKKSLHEIIAIYKQSPKFLILRAKAIWSVELYLILMVFFIFPTLFISYLFRITLMRSVLFLSLSSFILLTFSVIIIVRFSRPKKGVIPRALVIRKPTIFSKLKKAKGFVKLLEPKASSATYYEPELNSKFYIVKIVIKTLIFGLLLVALYLFLNSILKLQGLDKQSALELIRSSFLLIALFGFIISIIRFRASKFENFSLFFLFISLYELYRIELNWKFIPTLFAFIITIMLSILSWASYLKNRKTRERSNSLIRNNKALVSEDYVKKNVYNLIPLLFLFIDLDIFSTFIFALELPNLSTLFLSFPNINAAFYGLLYSVIYILLLALSIKSIIYYLKFYSFLIAGTFQPRIRTIIYRIIVIIPYYCLISHIFSLIGPRAYLLIFSSNLLQLIVFLMIKLLKNQQIGLNLRSQNNSMIHIRKIESARENRKFQEFIKSEIKKSEWCTLVYKDEYLLAPSHRRKSILTEEKAKEEKIIGIRNNLEGILKSLNYMIIPKSILAEAKNRINLLDVDLLALRVNEVSDNLRLLVIFPIKISDLNGRYIISEKKAYYEPLKQNYKNSKEDKKLVIGFETNQSNLNQNAILNSIREGGSLLNIINRKLNLSLDVHRTRTFFSKFNTYLQAGPVNVKVIINGILISHKKTGFFDQNLPFPYHKRSNTYFTPLKKFTSLVKYLEDKFAIIESVVEDNNSFEFEQNVNERYYKNMKFMRYPLIIQIIYAALTVTLFLILPSSFFPYYSNFYNANAFTFPFLFVILVIIYLDYLKKKIKVVVESLTPYYKRYLKTDEKNFNYILELQPKELTTQFKYEYL